MDKISSYASLGTDATLTSPTSSTSQPCAENCGEEHFIAIAVDLDQIHIKSVLGKALVERKMQSAPIENVLWRSIEPAG